MKANLQGKIASFSRIGEGEAEMHLKVTGKVNTTNIQAQPIKMDITCILKQNIADQMKIGDIVTITISNESSEV